MDEFLKSLAGGESRKRCVSSSSDEGKYLKPILVFWRREDDEPKRSLNLSLSPDLVPETPHANFVIKEKIKSALQLLTFREQRVLVQFWAPSKIGDRCVLTTSDQPFGLGLIDEGLRWYRIKSMGYEFFVEGENEEDLGPPGRVFQQRLPEWTPNVRHYSSNAYPQLNHAIRYNIQGSLALPVLEPSDGHCVGVLELALSSKYLDYAYEVREVCRALKDVNLKSSTIFDHPNMQICSDGHQFALDEIFNVLKVVCEAHELPLAQTWLLSGHCSVVAYDGVLKKSCGSFDVNCMGQLCMSTTGAPFYVVDGCMWRFWKACSEHHLRKGQGVVGWALSLNSSCFCRDVTQFSQTDYPLVHFARMYGLVSCFAVCLRNAYSGDNNYVIEFFLPPNITDIEKLKNLLDSLVVMMTQRFQSFKLASAEKLGEVFSAEVIKSSMDEKHDYIQLSHITRSPYFPKSLRNGGDLVQLDISDQQLMVVYDAKNSEMNVASAEQGDHAITNSEKRGNDTSADQRDSAITDSRRSSNVACAEESDSIITDLEKSIKFASAEHRDGVITDLENRSIVIAAEQSDDVIGQCNYSERKSNDDAIAYSDKKDTKKKLGRKRKLTEISISFDDLHQLFGMGLDEAAKSLGVSRSTMKRICREHGIPSWPRYKRNKDIDSVPKQRHMNESARSAEETFCQTSAVTDPLSASTSTLTDTISAAPLPVSLNQSSQQNEKLPFRRAPAAVSPPDSLVSAPPKTSPGGRMIEIAGNSNNLQQAVGHIPEISWSDPLCSDLSPKQAVANAADKMPQVKATQEVRTMTIKVRYRGDLLKFQFPLSSGWVELEEKVAKKLELSIGTFKIKYQDEDDDLILISCDEDFQNYMDTSRSMGITTIKLLVD